MKSMNSSVVGGFVRVRMQTIVCIYTCALASTICQIEINRTYKWLYNGMRNDKDGNKRAEMFQAI